MKRIRDQQFFFPITALVFIALQLAIFSRTPIRFYPDSIQYRALAQSPLFSLDFLAGIRPFTLPLFIKLFQDNMEMLTWFQLIFACGAWIYVAYAVSENLKSKFLKLATQFIMLGVGASSSFTCWHRVVLSESLSLSFLLLLTGMLFHLIAKKNSCKKPWAAALCLVLVLFSFCRDSNPYIILGFGTYFAVIAFIFRKRMKNWTRVVASLFLVCLSIFVLHTSAIRYAKRFTSQILDNIGVRILPNPDYTRFFSDRGMPVNNKTMAFKGKLCHLVDGDARVFEPWLSEKSMSVYVEFLLKHPITSMLAPLHPEPAMQIFNASLAGFRAIDVAPITAWEEAIDFIFYPTRLRLLLFGLVSLVVIWQIINKKVFEPAFLVPAMFLVMAYPQAFLIWHGDSGAPGRYAVALILQTKLLLWLFPLIYLDLRSTRKNYR